MDVDAIAKALEGERVGGVPLSREEALRLAKVIAERAYRQKPPWKQSPTVSQSP